MMQRSEAFEPNLMIFYEKKGKEHSMQEPNLVEEASYRRHPLVVTVGRGKLQL